MTAARQPDPQSRWLAHAVVGLVAGAIFGKKAGGIGAVVGFIGAIVVHEAMDAPVAHMLTDMGM